jgi:site-specific recombinase XerD
MFDQIFERAFTIRKHNNAPLLKQRLIYLQHSNECGNSPNTLRKIAQYLLRIIEFLNLENNTSLITTEEIEDAANKWARYQFNHPLKRTAFSLKSQTFFIRHATRWLKMLDRLKHPPQIAPLFHEIFERPHAIKKHTNAPLLEERLMYLHYRANGGALPGTLRRISYYLLMIMDYMQFYRIREVEFDEIKEAADKQAHQTSRYGKPIIYSKFSNAQFIKFASCWFKLLGCLILPEPLPMLFKEQLNQYLAYMRHEQGLAETTITHRLYMLQDFLKEVANTCESLGEMTPITIDEILIKKHDMDHYSRRTVQEYATVVRTFLRYQGNTGQCQLRLADTIKAPQVYKYESLPSSPSWDDVKVLLKGTEGDHPTSIRDRAILMLLSIYGLRSSEVANLRLDDIDWHNELLHLRRAKTSRPQTFPLIFSVGNVILRYITEIRPNDCSFREVFLRMRSPYRPLNRGDLYQIVRQRMNPLELAIKHHGPHALRHACATHLINEGVTLKEISDHLGHQDLEVTRIYTKVDLKSLRQIADFDIGDIL